MNTQMRHRLRRTYGMGATSASQLGVSLGTTVAQGASAATGAFGLTAGVLGSAAIPVVGAAIAAVGIGIEALINSSLVQGCGQTCIETSQWANQAEPLLQQNIEAYFALAAPRPISQQTAAVNNFMNIWNQLVKLCSQPGLGAAGKNCISDRQFGACKWKATSTGAYPGQPAQGQCWNWFNAYHDPIANDTQVYNDSLSTGAASTIGGTIAVAATGGGSDVLWIAGAIAAALFLVVLL